jgi:hypothetical protein
MSAKKSFLLRINPKIYEIYEKWAADEFRSVNAHIEYILRDAALRAGRWPASREATADADAHRPAEHETREGRMDAEDAD